MQFVFRSYFFDFSSNMTNSFHLKNKAFLFLNCTWGVPKDCFLRIFCNYYSYFYKMFRRREAIPFIIH